MSQHQLSHRKFICDSLHLFPSFCLDHTSSNETKPVGGLYRGNETGPQKQINLTEFFRAKDASLVPRKRIHRTISVESSKVNLCNVSGKARHHKKRTKTVWTACYTFQPAEIWFAIS